MTSNGWRWWDVFLASFLGSYFSTYHFFLFFSSFLKNSSFAAAAAAAAAAAGVRPLLLLLCRRSSGAVVCGCWWCWGFLISLFFLLCFCVVLCFCSRDRVLDKSTFFSNPLTNRAISNQNTHKSMAATKQSELGAFSSSCCSNTAHGSDETFQYVSEKHIPTIMGDTEPQLYTIRTLYTLYQMEMRTLCNVSFSTKKLSTFSVLRRYYYDVSTQE